MAQFALKTPPEKLKYTKEKHKPKENKANIHSGTTLGEILNNTPNAHQVRNLIFTGLPLREIKNIAPELLTPLQEAMTSDPALLEKTLANLTGAGTPTPENLQILHEITLQIPLQRLTQTSIFPLLPKNIQQLVESIPLQPRSDLEKPGEDPQREGPEDSGEENSELENVPPGLLKVPDAALATLLGKSSLDTTALTMPPKEQIRAVLQAGDTALNTLLSRAENKYLQRVSWIQKKMPSASPEETSPLTRNEQLGADDNTTVTLYRKAEENINRLEWITNPKTTLAQVVEHYELDPTALEDTKFTHIIKNRPLTDVPITEITGNKNAFTALKELSLTLETDYTTLDTETKKKESWDKDRWKVEQGLPNDIWRLLTEPKEGIAAILKTTGTDGFISPKAITDLLAFAKDKDNGGFTCNPMPVPTLDYIVSNNSDSIYKGTMTLDEFERATFLSASNVRKQRPDKELRDNPQTFVGRSFDRRIDYSGHEKRIANYNQETVADHTRMATLILTRIFRELNQKRSPQEWDTVRAKVSGLFGELSTVAEQMNNQDRILKNHIGVAKERNNFYDDLKTPASMLGGSIAISSLLKMDTGMSSFIDAGKEFGSKWVETLNSLLQFNIGPLIEPYIRLITKLDTQGEHGLYWLCVGIITSLVLTRLPDGVAGFTGLRDFKSSFVEAGRSATGALLFCTKTIGTAAKVMLPGDAFEGYFFIPLKAAIAKAKEKKAAPRFIDIAKKSLT